MKIGEFFKKETAGLPNWAWLAILLAGGGIGYLIVKNRGTVPSPAAPSVASPTSAATLAATAASQPGAQESQAGAFPTTQVGTNTIPVIPSGFAPVYDQNGNLVSFQQGTQPSQQGTPQSGQQNTPTTVTATTRGYWTGEAQGGNLPVFPGPGVEFNQAGNFTNSIGSVPHGTQVTVTGPVIQGVYANRSATYVPVLFNGLAGYMLSSDLANPPSGQGANYGGVPRPRQRGLVL